MVPTSIAPALRPIKHELKRPPALQARPTPCQTAVRIDVHPAEPLLLRVARGEKAERCPVWLMRQAGRYMAAFRRYSTRLGFRARSENAEIATELSLQPWEAFRPDGVILFSDILTVLPALGAEFDVIPGKGPVVQKTFRSKDDIQGLSPLDDPSKSLHFTGDVLKSLRQHVGNQSTVLGFVGSPWTLAGYMIEGSASKHCPNAKAMAAENPALYKALLDHLTAALIVYARYQIDAGAQVVQVFDSWAHILTPAQFATMSMPYAEQLVQGIHASHPHVPVIFHANGGVGKADELNKSSATVLGLDWMTDMADARAHFGKRCLQGNVDPGILLGPAAGIEAAVEACCRAAGPHSHILGLGHGVPQTTPEENVKLFVDLGRNSAKYREATGEASAESLDLEQLRERSRLEVGLVGC